MCIVVSKEDINFYVDFMYIMVKLNLKIYMYTHITIMEETILR